jgi:hypothetical protein
VFCTEKERGDRALLRKEFIESRKLGHLKSAKKGEYVEVV